LRFYLAPTQPLAAQPDSLINSKKHQSGKFSAGRPVLPKKALFYKCSPAFNSERAGSASRRDKPIWKGG
jgi:hypothetical protein